MPEPGAPMPAAIGIDFVIPHFESDEEEIAYPASRPARLAGGAAFDLGSGAWTQELPAEPATAERIEVALAAPASADGVLELELVPVSDPGAPSATGRRRLEPRGEAPDLVSVVLERLPGAAAGPARLRMRFRPDRPGSTGCGAPRLRLAPAEGESGPFIAMRLFRRRRRHAGRHLERCLASLAAHAGAVPERIHVAAGPGSAAANRNAAFRRTSRPLVCFLDDDVELPPRFSLAPLVAELAAGRADLVAPKILDREGTIFCADPGFDADLEPRPRGLGEPDRGQYDYVRAAPWLPSTFLLVRRRVVTAVGGFSEEFAGSQVEDVDFCLEARTRGFRCAYVGTTAVVHASLQRNDRHRPNSALLERKWRSALPALARGFDALT